MKVSFLVRASKVGKNGLCPIECAVSVNGSRKIITVDRRVKESDFNPSTQKVRGNKELNTYLDVIRSKFYEVERRMIQEGIDINAESICNCYKNGFKSSRTIGEMFDAYIKELSPRVGKDLTMESYKKYTYVRDFFLSLVDKDTSASDVTNSDGLKYLSEVTRKYKPQTAFGYVTKMKSFFIYGLNNGYIKTNPMATVTYKRKVEEVEFLTTEELRKIEEASFDIPTYDKIRDLFLFQCYTGLAYCDMSDLKKEDVQECEYGKFIQKARKKTKVKFTILLSEKAMAILDKYDWVLPMLSNQKYNLYLHMIQDALGLTKKLHTHIGRHTAATQMLNKGMRLEVVSKILGHTNTRQTVHYAKLIDKTVLSEMSAFM